MYVNCQPNHRFGTVHHVAHWDFSCLHRSSVRNSRIAMLTHTMLVCSLELRLTFISPDSRPFYTENCPPDSFPGVSNPPAAVRLRSHMARPLASPGRQRRKSSSSTAHVVRNRARTARTTPTRTTVYVIRDPNHRFGRIITRTTCCRLQLRGFPQFAIVTYHASA